MLKYNKEDFNNSVDKDLVECYCSNCNKSYYIRKKQIKKKIKLNQKNQYCSADCQYDGKRFILRCTNCDKKVYKIKSELKKVKNSFCSQSCAASFNNMKYPKRNSHGKCKICNVSINKTKKFCPECLMKKEIDWENKSLGEAIYLKQGKQNLATTLRIKARRIMKDKKGCCEYCNYRINTHVCHIKPISFFKETSLISEVNKPSNLIVLCPNHHWEFDNILEKRQDIIKVVSATRDINDFIMRT